jgi:adenylate kinase family enzyme
VRRILVTGITGAGTTLAQAMAGRLGIGFHEMDALALCGPAWQENPSLLNDVEAITAGPGWVFDSASATDGRAATAAGARTAASELGTKSAIR